MRAGRLALRASIHDAEAWASVRPLDIVTYLKHAGWEPVEDNGHRLVRSWTRHDPRDDADFEVLVPHDRTLGDYVSRVADVVRTLAVAEDRSELDVLEGLTQSAIDVVRARLRDSQRGSISLEDGVEVVDGLRDLMLSAASSAVEPKPNYPTRKPDAAMEYVNSLRLGQTDRGSYVFKVLSPVPPIMRRDGELFADVEEPFARRVTRTLFTGFRAIKSAVQSVVASGEFDHFMAAVPQGVSANLCAALHQIARPVALHPLSLDIAWSSNRPRPEGIGGEVPFDEDELEIVGEAARVFRETAPTEDFELVGVVVRLRREDDAETGVATVIGVVENDLRRVRVELGGPDYNLAIRSHKHRISIRLKGTLVKEGRQYELRSPHAVELLEEEE